jgi:nucleoside-diphosphate-sugar epimerase
MTRKAAVLVTGSAGRIGQAAVQELHRRGHAVRGIDVVPTPGIEDCVVGSITDPTAVRTALAGVGTVVHLAATPDDDDFHTKLLPNNILGVYEVFEAARAAGVKRLVLASSGQVVWWQRMTGTLPITADVQPTPRGWYAATKMFQEAAGRAFAEMYGISVIVARLGWCPRSSAQIEELVPTVWALDVYLSPGDAGRFFASAVDAPLDIRYLVVYPTSRPVQTTYYDLSGARQFLGYEPQDTWPQGVEDMMPGRAGHGGGSF